jgi:hypothetical protein
MERIHRTGGRLVWALPDGTYAIDADLRGRSQRLAPVYFIPSATPGRVWFVSARPRSIVEMTVRGRVTLRSSVRLPWRCAVVAAVEHALICPDGEADTLRAVDPTSGRVVRNLPGTFPFATHGSLVASCNWRCRDLHLTDVETGLHRSVPPPNAARYIEGYDGAFSPDGSLLAVPVKTSRGRAQVGLVDVRRGSVRVIPGSRLAGYRKFSWSSSGDLYFAAARGRIMVYRPGSQRARLLPVKLGAPILDLAAG